MVFLLFLGTILLNHQIADSNVADSKGKQAKLEVEPWSYFGKNGPNSWMESFPSCGGKMQSPIKIERTQAKRIKMERIEFYGYNIIRRGMTVINNGHTAQLLLAEGEENKPYIAFGGLGAKYTFAQLHFHWSKEDFEGSEHVLYEVNYGRSLEVHFVHLNADEAKNGNAGIAVLGLSFQASSRDNVMYSPITNALDEIRYKGKVANISKSFSLDSLLPDLFRRKNFFRYNGSLTTPPCTEGVIWSVFEDSTYISRSQMKKFRSLYKTSEGELEEFIDSNFRPIQPLNGRRVLRIRGMKPEKWLK